MRVEQLPSECELTDIATRHPGIRVELLKTENLCLSQNIRDDSSFIYGIINLCGRDRADVLQSLRDCLSRLTFAFVPLVQVRQSAASLADLSTG